MALEWNDTALILRLGQFRENDLWLRLLSRGRGIFTAFAFGGSRSKRRFCGCLDLLNVVKCRIKSTRQGAYLCMQEGVLLRGPITLRKDYGRYGMAMNCVRFMEAMGVAEEGAGTAFELLDESLRSLEAKPPPHKFFPLFFRFALACGQGFTPSLNFCAICGRHMPDCGELLVAEGRLICRDCGKKGQNGIFLSGPALDLLRQVQQNSPSAWDAGALHWADQRALARYIDDFINYHMGIIWDDGGFRKL